MTIRVACNCGKQFKAPRHLAGKRVKCPACGGPLEIPQAHEGMLDVSWVRCPFCHEYVDETEFPEHRAAHMKRREDGQQTDYATLPTEHRDASINLRNEPRWYFHAKCGKATGMPDEIRQTYLTNPWFYSSDRTFCHGCHRHVPQKELVWQETGENVQTYVDRLRAAKPELRPGLVSRAIISVLKLFFR